MADSPLLLLIVLITLIFFANVVMFAVVRGLARGNGDWLQRLRRSLERPMDRDHLQREQLRREVAALRTGAGAREAEAAQSEAVDTGKGDRTA